MSARPPAPDPRRASARLAMAARQPTILAFLVALGVAALLALLVLLPWSGGGSSGTEADATRLAAIGPQGIDGPTPTPRTIRPAAGRRGTPAASPSAGPATGAVQAAAEDAGSGEGETPAIAGRPSGNPDQGEPAAPASTKVPPKPTATAAPPTATAVPTATPPPEPVFEVAGPAALASLAANSWALEGDQLASTGPPKPEPWIVAPEAPPAGDYAVEAEFRVRDLAPGLCAQSFGLVVGDRTTAVWGGGVYYPCADRGPGPLARFTDVTNAADGYYADPELESEPIELDPGWRTLRLEVRGTELTLLIDDEETLTTTVERDAAGPGEQVGFWSEGVRVGLRRLAVFELDDEGT